MESLNFRDCTDRAFEAVLSTPEQHDGTAIELAND